MSQTRISRVATLFALITTFMVAGSSVVRAQVPDAGQSTVEPWDTYGHVLVSPGTQSSVDSVIITVRDAVGNPVPNVPVTVSIAMLPGLAFDLNPGLTATTDGAGRIILNPRIGGSRLNSNVTVEAGGVVLRTFANVLSPDFDGSAGNGVVNATDLGYFDYRSSSAGYDPLLDLDGNHVLGPSDRAIILAAIAAGDSNSYTSDGSWNHVGTLAVEPLPTARLAVTGTTVHLLGDGPLASTGMLAASDDAFRSIRFGLSGSGLGSPDTMFLSAVVAGPDGGDTRPLPDGCCLAYNTPSCMQVPDAKRCTIGLGTYYAGYQCESDGACHWEGPPSGGVYGGLTGPYWWMWAPFGGHGDWNISMGGYLGPFTSQVEVRNHGSTVGTWTLPADSSLRCDLVSPSSLSLEAGVWVAKWSTALTVHSPVLGDLSGDEIRLSQPGGTTGTVLYNGLYFFTPMPQIDLVGVESSLDRCACTETWGAEPTGPAARSLETTAYDETRHEMVLFGGFDGSQPLADTWVMDNGTWSLRAPLHSPSARYGAKAVYDPDHEVVVLQGGSDGVNCLSDTWTWNGSDWAQVATNGPQVCSHAGMAYDPVARRVVHYGGNTATGRSAATFEWDGSSWTLITASSGPGYRSGHAMAWDASSGSILMFGGEIPGNARTADNWRYSASTHTWAALASGGPTPRSLHAMAAQPYCGRILLYGGQSDAGPQADLWEYDGSWHSLGASEAPGPLLDHGLVYDPWLDQTLVMCGNTGAALTDSVWSLHCTSASGITDVSPGGKDVAGGLQFAVYPNPTHGASRLEYTLGSSGRVSIALFDVSGRMVWHRPDTIEQGGRHTLLWPGADDSGHPARAGVYFARVRSGQQSETRMILIVR